MLHELYLYLTEKVNPNAKYFGHLKESISLVKRQKRCFAYWESHQNNCKNLIKEYAESIEQKNSILILGSGPTHEIPVEYLSGTFKKVTLVDIVHLRSTIKKYEKLKNVEFIVHDISELETSIKDTQNIYNCTPSRFLNENYDFVVSANLLSQIPYHLKNYIDKNLSHLPEARIDEFCFQVSKDHFNYLKKFNCPVLIITDTETQTLNNQKQITEIETPYINFDLPKANREWMWNLAPAPEINQQISLQMKVVGIILNQ